MLTVLEAVEAEQVDLTEALRASPAAALVRQLAGALDLARDPSAIATLSREFRAASDALREAVARAGKRGDAVDELGAQRAARRKPDPANTRRTAERKQ